MPFDMADFLEAVAEGQQLFHGPVIRKFSAANITQTKTDTEVLDFRFDLVAPRLKDG